MAVILGHIRFAYVYVNTSSAGPSEPPTIKVQPSPCDWASRRSCMQAGDVTALWGLAKYSVISSTQQNTRCTQWDL